MSLLSRLLLCYDLLRATRARDWRLFIAGCDAYCAQLSRAEMLAQIKATTDLETERQQVAAGTRTTREAEVLLAQARVLVQPKARP